ncbi:MAG: FecR domain-containing protein [Acidobacteria bacterium]|nr:FecR domain-containing protein [Acidobacteriota bacterium]
MKSIARLFQITILACFICGASMAATAQSRDTYVISARAGLVNLVSGTVTYQHAGEMRWRSMASVEELGPGDRVRTSAGGRVEILLNPGSYLRLNENSEFELTNPSFDDLQISLLSGNAIIEMTGTDGSEVFMKVLTPKQTFSIIDDGLYRVNVLPDGISELLIRKGKAALASDPSKKIKDGRKIIASAAEPTIEKFDKKKDQDMFDMWSGQRAELLATANSRLTDNRILTGINAYQAAGNYGFGYRPFYGLWLYDPFLSGYSFFPFYSSWFSPYGFNYSICYGLPWWYYRPLPYGYFPNGYGGTGAGTGTGTGTGTGGTSAGNDSKFTVAPPVRIRPTLTGGTPGVTTTKNNKTTLPTSAGQTLPTVSGSAASTTSIRPTSDKKPREFPTPAQAISIRSTLDSMANSERGYTGGGYTGSSATSTGRGGGGAGRVTAAPSAGSTPRPTNTTLSPGRTRNN